jgi:GNAT superfamily N-acetyltransferase
VIEFVRVLPGDDPKIAAIHDLFTEYQQALGIDLCFQDFGNELENLPGKYAPPSGELLLILLDGQPVASGAMRDLGDGICELKRIYVRPGARRRGIARSTSERLIESARTIGYRAMRLDTLKRLVGATELYEDLGFVYIEPYNNATPEEDIVFMEKIL